MSEGKRKTGTKLPKDVELPQENIEGEKHELIKRNVYDRLKRRAINFERKNNRFILVIPVDGNKGWCEVGERSALFYKYEVCDKIGADVSIKNDYDSFYNQFEIGRARMIGFEVVRNRLKRAGLYKKEQLRDKCMLFEMNRTFSDDEIEQLLVEEKRRQTEINNIVKVKLMDPVLLVKMLEVSARMHAICLNKMDKLARDTNGRRIVELCDEMIIDYYKMSAAEDISPEARLKMWRKLREYTQSLMIELQLVVGLKIWKRNKCISIGEMIYEIEERLDSHIRKLVKKV